MYTPALGVLFLASVACASQKEERCFGNGCGNDLYPRASWSYSQPGGNGGWPEYTHSMIVPSYSPDYPYPAASSYAPFVSAYPTSYYPSNYPTASGSWSTWPSGPTAGPGSGSGSSQGQGQGGQGQASGQGQGQAPQSNAATSSSRGGVTAAAVIALGTLTGVAAFFL